MAFSENELKFLEENRDLIEEGESAVNEIIAKVIEYPSEGFLRSKLIFAIVYSVQGVKGFSAAVTAEYKSSTVEGALLNRTSAKAKASPLLPQMLKSKTKIVYYRIENNKIVKEDRSEMKDLATYKDTLSSNNYNLVILDTPDNVRSVKEAFGGVVKFTVRFLAEVAKSWGYLKTVVVEDIDPDKAKEKAKVDLTEAIAEKIGMDQAVKAAVTYAVDQADFKV